MTYKISLDTTSKVITIFILAFVALFVIGPWSPFANSSENFQIYAAVVLIIIFGLTFLFKPQSYTMTAENILVNRLISKVKISKEDIHFAEKIDKEDIKWSFRTFGSGGFFGYFGKFTNRKIGAMIWYVSRKDSLVLLKMKSGKKIVLSPDDRDGFISAINY